MVDEIDQHIYAPKQTAESKTPSEEISWQPWVSGGSLSFGSALKTNARNKDQQN